MEHRICRACRAALRRDVRRGGVPLSGYALRHCARLLQRTGRRCLFVRDPVRGGDHYMRGASLCAQEKSIKEKEILEEFKAKMDGYAEKLTELFAEGNALQAEIIEQLKKVKYE